MTRPTGMHAAAASVLGHAFAGDPAFRHALPDDARRVAQLTWLCARVMRFVELSGGRVDVAGDGPRAVALWAPVTRAWREPLGRLVRSGLAATPFVLGLGAVRRLAALGRVTGALHAALAPVPHDYLLQLAVAPGEQGRGLGSALLREGLERSSRAGRAVWLETTNPANVAFYERHGFEVAGRRVAAEGVEVVGLVRRPGTAE
ncbi:MAG: GNAT family N-acetyltransferase [Myxococcota bacterium]